MFAYLRLSLDKRHSWSVWKYSALAQGNAVSSRQSSSQAVREVTWGKVLEDLKKNLMGSPRR